MARRITGLRSLKLATFPYFPAVLNPQVFSFYLLYPHSYYSNSSHSYNNEFKINHKHQDNDNSSCWSCGKIVDKMDLFCSQTNCGVVQSLHSKDINIFDTFELDMQYLINESKLDQTYKNLQKKLHPDKFATKSLGEQSASTSASTTINMAYQVCITLRSHIFIL
jgi:preprotein translocase subunit Sec63